MAYMDEATIKMCEAIIEEIGAAKCTYEVKLTKLHEKMGEVRFSSMQEEFMNSEDPESVYFRFLRQFGTPLRLKRRKLNLERKYDLTELLAGSDNILDEFKIIDHYAVHFDNRGDMFHFLPDGTHYGQLEYNKEVANDWELYDMNDGKPFFTLMSTEEIVDFCKKWDNHHKYDLSMNSSKLFVDVLTYWLL